MKTKREVLESVVKIGSCKDIKCSDCPYLFVNCHDRLFKIGAMAILRQNRKSKKREFDTNKILTCVTADKAKVGMWGYASDNLSELRYYFMNNLFCELIEIKDDSYACRFGTSGTAYALFYPIDDDVEVEE